MKYEIGSEFWSVPIVKKENNVFPGNVKWFLSGRIALMAILAENHFKTAALPSWCCESMIQPFLDAGVKVSFYSAPGVVEGIHADVILAIDYFGYVGSCVFHNCSGVLIRDLTHSIFSANYCDADYYFGSLRKWCGFWTGGFAWGFYRDVQYCVGGNEYIELRQRAMQEKMEYLFGNTSEKHHLETFENAEKLLDASSIFQAASRDIECALRLDVNHIVTRRRSNAVILYDAFHDICVFPEIHDSDCPLFVPIRLPYEQRESLRKILIQNAIYCPVHWPLSQWHHISEEDAQIYDEELSLICDQRYTEKDMIRMVTIIQDYLKV